MTLSALLGRPLCCLTSAKRSLESPDNEGLYKKMKRFNVE